MQEETHGVVESKTDLETHPYIYRALAFSGGNFLNHWIGDWTARQAVLEKN